MRLLIVDLCWSNIAECIDMQLLSILLWDSWNLRRSAFEETVQWLLASFATRHDAKFLYNSSLPCLVKCKPPLFKTFSVMLEWRTNHQWCCIEYLMRSLLTDFTDSLWASLRVVNSDNTTSAPQVDWIVLARPTIMFAISYENKSYLERCWSLLFFNLVNQVCLLQKVSTHAVIGQFSEPYSPV